MRLDVLAGSVPKEQKNKAYWLYLYGQSVEDISNTVGLPENLIRHWIKGPQRDADLGWKKIRETKNGSIVSFFVQHKKEVLENTWGVALSILADGLQKMQKDIADNDKKLNLRDMKGLSEIISDLDKIARLEAGQATSIIRQAGLTAAEAEKIIKEDPFACVIIEVEGREL